MKSKRDIARCHPLRTFYQLARSVDRRVRCHSARRGFLDRRTDDRRGNKAHRCLYRVYVSRDVQSRIACPLRIEHSKTTITSCKFPTLNNKCSEVTLRCKTKFFYETKSPEKRDFISLCASSTIQFTKFSLKPKFYATREPSSPSCSSLACQCSYLRIRRKRVISVSTARYERQIANSSKTLRRRLQRKGNICAVSLVLFGQRVA